MKKLFVIANRYIENSDWKIIAVLKFCLISLGMLLGMLIREDHKKKVRPAAAGIFFLTYVPLMAKFYRTMKEVQKEGEDQGKDDEEE
ncbi:MAG: permease of phosphate ABC transporter [Lachnospiraceae bacterium]|nr:permease of phosphate ABC transporter [Lachnospiraceae bacterium]